VDPMLARPLGSEALSSLLARPLGPCALLVRGLRSAGGAMVSGHSRSLRDKFGMFRRGVARYAAPPGFATTTPSQHAAPLCAARADGFCPARSERMFYRPVHAALTIFASIARYRASNLPIAWRFSTTSGRSQEEKLRFPAVSSFVFM